METRRYPLEGEESHKSRLMSGILDGSLEEVSPVVEANGPLCDLHEQPFR